MATMAFAFFRSIFSRARTSWLCREDWSHRGNHVPLIRSAGMNKQRDLFKDEHPWNWSWVDWQYVARQVLGGSAIVVLYAAFLYGCAWLSS
jgi:hypothetical protein